MYIVVADSGLRNACPRPYLFWFTYKQMFVNKFHRHLIFLTIVLIVLPVVALAQFGSKNMDLKVVEGVLDLRNHDFASEGLVRMKGQWKFRPGLADKWEPGGEPVAVPGSWDEASFEGKEMDRYGTVSYFLQVLLPPESPDLYLKIPTVFTAYELWINDQMALRSGVVGEDEASTKPFFKPQTVRVSPVEGEMRILIRIANFHHRKSGLLVEPILGTRTAISELTAANNLVGGGMAGVFLAIGLIFTANYVYRRRDRYNLFFSLQCLFFTVNILLVTEHRGYAIMGADHWEYALRLEFVNAASLLWMSLLVVSSFFSELFSRSELRMVTGYCAGMALFAIFAPIKLVAWLDIAVGISVFFFLLLGVWKLAQGVLAHRQSALVIGAILLVTGVVAAFSGVFKGEPITEVVPMHYAMVLNALVFAAVLARKNGWAFQAVERLSTRLEKANRKLAVRNRTLEEEVKQRTRQLVEAEKKTHELEMEKKDRDMAALSSNNIMKMQLTQNLIGELTALAKSKDDPQKKIKQLIARLKGQAATEEKLQVLQKDMDRINAEFYSRLEKKYPKLSKTERELCAYLKLNLSSKDIADLRRTTMNTINVSRHRLRKKLGLERGDELEGFIQKI